MCVRACSGERDALYERFQAALHDVKQKTGFRHLLLERRLAAATEEVERQTIALSEMLKAANLDSSALGRVQGHLAEVMGAKDGAIADLKGDLARIAAAHDRLIETYEKRMAEYGELRHVTPRPFEWSAAQLTHHPRPARHPSVGIPMEELGFTPLRAGDIVTSLASAAVTVAGAAASATVGRGLASGTIGAGGGGAAGGAGFSAAGGASAGAGGVLGASSRRA